MTFGYGITLRGHSAFGELPDAIPARFTVKPKHDHSAASNWREDQHKMLHCVHCGAMAYSDRHQGGRIIEIKPG